MSGGLTLMNSQYLHQHSLSEQVEGDLSAGEAAVEGVGGWGGVGVGSSSALNPRLPDT